MKTIEEMKPLIETYFSEVNTLFQTLKPSYHIIFNMDEVPIFFELCTDQTLDIRGRKVIGRISSGKDKERITLIITASANGDLLPPFLIFKAHKPKGESIKDYPKKEIVNFDVQTSKFVERYQIKAVQNYSAWNTKRIMQKHYIPYFLKHAPKNAMLFFDNHSSHIADEVLSDFQEKGINYINLPPNTTPICQSVDIHIGGNKKIFYRMVNR